MSSEQERSTVSQAISGVCTLIGSLEAKGFVSSTKRAFPIKTFDACIHAQGESFMESSFVSQQVP